MNQILQKVNSRQIYSLLLIAFLLHNTEEAISVCNFPVSNPFSFIQPVECIHFITAVSVLSVAAAVLYLWAMKSGSPAVYYFISTAFASALLLNAVFPHLVLAVYTLQYTPGIFTAITFILPLGCILLFRNKSWYKSIKHMSFHILGGLAAGYAIFAITMLFVSRFT